MFHQQYSSGSNSPMSTSTPVKRGRGRPPKNRSSTSLRQQPAAPQSPQRSEQSQQQQHSSPRLRAPPIGHYQNGSSSYQPQLPSTPSQYHPSSVPPPEQSQPIMYPQQHPNYFGTPTQPQHIMSSFSSMSDYQHQQQSLQQHQQQSQHQQQQQQQSQQSQHLQQNQPQNHDQLAQVHPTFPVSNHHGSSSTHASTIPSHASSSYSQTTIKTPARSNIGAGLGQAVGNAGTSLASRTRKKTDTSEPDLKTPEQADLGWMPKPSDVDQAQSVYKTILDTVRNFTSSDGRKLSESLEQTPDPELDPEYYERIEKPTSLQAIEQRIISREYVDAVAFELDMLQLFENGRRSYPIGSATYGDIVILQRLYHQLTKSKASASSHTTQETVLAAATQADPSKFFSSIPVGPGYATAGTEGELATRINTKMKTYYEHLNFKGKAFRVGDWIHLINPSDPTKPIVAQIFKVMRRDDSPDQGWVTVCWYFRPEQTFHSPSKMFYKNEVVKTGYFVDHQIEDVLENIMVMFYTKFIRGRPKPEYWDPKSPLYVTESRYNQQQKVFHKIKSWVSCVPEEIRKVETPMNYFDKAISPPPRQESPFLRGVAGPGALQEEDVSRDSHDFPDLFKDSQDDSRPKKRSKGGDQHSTRLPGAMMNPSSSSSIQVQARPSASQVFTNLASQVAARLNPQDYLRIQQLLSDPESAANADVVQLSQSVGGVDPNLLSALRDAAIAAGVTSTTGSGVAAGSELMDIVSSQKGDGFFSELPATTQDLFADQPGGQVSWYPAPPLDGPVQNSLHRNGFWTAQEQATPSLDYLYDQVIHQASTANQKSSGKGETNPSHQPAITNGNSTTPRAMLYGPSSYVAQHEATPPLSSENSPFPLESSFGIPGHDGEAITPFVTQNGWFNDWGQDPLKTAEALAEFTSQMDHNQLNF